MAAVMPIEQTMKQTPAHSVVNRDLLALMPPSARRVVEVGCMHGALAETFRAINPKVHYTGIDIDADYAQVARQRCDVALSGDIELFDASTFSSLFDVMGAEAEHYNLRINYVNALTDGQQLNANLLSLGRGVGEWLQ